MRASFETNFGKLASFRNGLNFNNENQGIGCKIIGVSDFGDKLTPDYDSLDEINPKGIIKEVDYLQNGDILFVRSNGNKNLVGRSMYINNVNEKIVFSGFCIRARLNSQLANPLFYAYFFKTKLFRKIISSIAGGANIQNLNQGLLDRAIVPMPSLEVQNKIATLLSAYDDLIENNLKRIKLMEEIAQRTYEEWFVKFRVNGRQLIIDEKTGLPEGWRLVSVKDYSEEISKGPSLNYDNDGNKFPVINKSCIRNGEIELEKILFAQELSNNKQNCYLKINDILINSMGQGTLGRVSKNVSINERFIIHNCITFVRAKEIFSQYQLFYFLSSKQSYFEGVAQGSTGQTTLKVSLIEELEIQLAPKKIIDHFNSIIKPLWEQMGILKKQNQKLKESRDILLPKLMNGTINV